jgi:hypothetical protein
MPILPKKPRSQKLEERAATKDKKADFYRQSNVNMQRQVSELEKKKSGMIPTEKKSADKLISKMKKNTSNATLKSIGVSEKAFKLRAKAEKLKSKGK